MRVYRRIKNMILRLTYPQAQNDLGSLTIFPPNVKFHRYNVILLNVITL